MIKNNLYKIIIMLSAFIFPQSLEVDFGWHNPQGPFDQYTDPGTSFRLTYSNVGEKQHIKYDLSFQSLNFMTDSWFDQHMTVTHSEQSWGLLYGPRIMSPTRKGAIRPYFGLKAGIFVFSETMRYEWEDEWDAWDWACLFFDFLDDDDTDVNCFEDNTSHYTNTLDTRFYFGAILETGANIKINENMGIDLGIQYNIIPNLRAIDSDYLEDEENLSLQITQIARTINADYVTFYFGLYFNLNNNGAK